MYLFLRTSGIRLAGGLLERRSFRTAEDCLSLLSNGSNVETQELYDAFKFLATNHNERLSAVKDSRFVDLISEVENRLPSLNSSYMGNFALRIATVSQSAGGSATTHGELCRGLVSKIATAIIDKGARARELAQVAYATSAIGIDSDAIFELSKQTITTDIDSVTPDALNFSLQAAYKRNSRDKIYYALLCEKLCELTERFTANDVINTLRALAKTGLLKGFLLRRLSTLVMDNLDQFTHEQLCDASYRLGQMKFMTPTNFGRIYATVESSLGNLNDRTRVHLLAAGCYSEYDKREDLESLLGTLKYKERWELSACIDYVFSCAYLRLYNDELPRVIEGIFKYTPTVSRKYGLILKESLDAFAVESAPVEYSIPPRWKDLLDHCEKTESELNKHTPGYQEIHKILQGSSSNFAESKKVDPFMVPFVDEERKLVILIEYASNMSNLVVKKRCLETLGHKVGIVKYWDWRRLKTESSQADYISRLLTTLSR
ncbi:RAP domain family protein [Babesia bovis T2Bo]|uniref:RAP domain family protein n=1 Tax=Babesia bovis T2Bo TaxID=484906 RepID=UPI001C34EAB8|nr:RAP domain family protein [Babesia bovis T2Bo]KAG6440030.1 RAP domain family protein [Babesia bovis T2Bo]